MEDQQASGWGDIGELVAKNDASQVPFYLAPANKQKIKEVSAAKGVPVEAMLGNIQKSLSLGQTTPQKAQQELDAHHATVIKKPSVGMAKKLPQKVVSPMAMPDVQQGPMGPPAPSTMDNPQAQPDDIIQDTALVRPRGYFESDTAGDSNKHIATTNEKTRLDSDALKQQYEQWSGLPVNKETDQYSDDIKNKLKMLSNEKENLWIKPLLALADSETGSKLMAGYNEPIKEELILKYQDALAKNNARKSEDFNKYLTAGATGSASDAFTVAEYNKTIEGMKDPAVNMQDRMLKMDNMAHQQNINIIKRDPILRTFDNNRATLENGLNIIAGNHTNKQVLHELQVATRPALLAMAGAARLTGAEREAQQVESVASNFEGWIQKITGRPQGAYMPKDDPILKHLKDLINTGIGSIKGLGPKRIQFLSQGNRSMYERNPDKKQDLQDLMNAWVSTGGMKGSFQDGAYNPNEALPTKENAAEGVNPATMQLQKKIQPKQSFQKSSGSSGTTNLIGPDGKVRAIKNSLVEQALAAGGKRQ